jgi:hypothetical protein
LYSLADQLEGYCILIPKISLVYVKNRLLLLLLLLLIPVLLFVVVVVVEEEDCANANLVVNDEDDDIDGTAVRLSVSPNKTIKKHKDILLEIFIITMNYQTEAYLYDLRTFVTQKIL